MTFCFRFGGVKCQNSPAEKSQRPTDSRNWRVSLFLSTTVPFRTMLVFLSTFWAGYGGEYRQYYCIMYSS